MDNKRVHIIFVLPSLAAGGAERILSYVASRLDKSIFSATLVITGYEKDTVYSVDNLNVVYLNMPRVLKAFGSLFKYLKKEKPDIVVSSIVHLNTIMAFMSPFFSNTKFVVREANVLSVLNKYNPYTKSIFPKFMVVLAYKLVDCIICQSKDMRNDMINNYKVKASKMVLINNPITQAFKTKVETPKNKKTLKFITIGRLSKEKGHIRIIEALSKLNYPFHYTIIGKGPEKGAIFDYINHKNLINSIQYIEYTNEVEHYLTDSDLFLQGSYSEGFPNVLIESSVVGTPILAYNGVGGLDEIIEIEKNGYIANSLDEFVNYLNVIHDNFPFKPHTVSQVVVNKFSSSKIMAQYTNLFLNLTKQN
ncbi:glycosyltransferase [Hanstruepera marina]|uniref:glycosyltransferase n=1 Tax=Hanstruepera marina TaxID=2873265 RepID=UPI001CA75F94|nr:glycosyltransferase [Hanstruepera marina]